MKACQCEEIIGRNDVLFVFKICLQCYSSKQSALCFLKNSSNTNLTARFAYVFLVKKLFKHTSHISATYFNFQTICIVFFIRVSALFRHPNLLPLLDHAIIPVKYSSTKKITGLQLCAGLKHLHTLDPPYAHNDVKPGNVLLTHRKGQPPLAILMDFESARPARRQIRSRSEALQLQLIDKVASRPKPPYPDVLHQFVSWMLQPQATVRPHVIVHVDKLISKFSL
ncbi:hypothetical protein QVD17_01644 [Tagetes erecta]|uniref:non-specific serine/threonine protein kinase n=1 Tax=Tagetes erecta TaxID=13708 RepID=A0AAD8P8B6_TARER|nr:hypothetical protein QVD17_01644 [Tagetes erecta]